MSDMSPADYSRLSELAHQIDAVRDDADDVEATETLARVIRELGELPQTFPGVRYCQGTARSTMALCLMRQQASTSDGYNVTRRVLSLARADLDSAAGRDDIGQRALTNLGNALIASARVPEAIRLYRSVPTPLASGWLASTLSFAAGTGWMDIQDAAADIARLKAAALAVPEELNARAEGSADRIRRIPDPPPAQSSPDLLQPTDPYLRWVASRDLHLRLLPERVDPDGRDRYRLPHLRSSNDTQRDMSIFAMMNTLRADYLFTRRFAWEAVTNGVHRDGGGYIDTLDYAAYGESAARITLAYRAAVDLLDRVAVLANSYFSAGLPVGSIHFHKAWWDRDDRLLKAYAEEIDKRNPGLFALIELADDLRSGGMLDDARTLRNAATHRFVVWHIEGAHWSNQEEIWRESVLDAEQRLTEGLWMVRNGLLYLLRAMTMREHRLLRQRTAPPLPLIALEQEEWHPPK